MAKKSKVHVLGSAWGSAQEGKAHQDTGSRMGPLQAWVPILTQRCSVSSKPSLDGSLESCVPSECRWGAERAGWEWGFHGPAGVPRASRNSPGAFEIHHQALIMWPQDTEDGFCLEMRQVQGCRDSRDGGGECPCPQAAPSLKVSSIKALCPAPHPQHTPTFWTDSHGLFLGQLLRTGKWKQKLDHQGPSSHQANPDPVGRSVFKRSPGPLFNSLLCRIGQALPLQLLEHPGDGPHHVEGRAPRSPGPPHLDLAQSGGCSHAALCMWGPSSGHSTPHLGTALHSGRLCGTLWGGVFSPILWAQSGEVMCPGSHSHVRTGLRDRLLPTHGHVTPGPP